LNVISFGTPIDSCAGQPFLGLAPFLRLSIAGIDIMPACQEMIEQAQQRPEDANAWMNLSIALLSLGLREEGLNVQAQALDMQRIYHLSAEQQPAKLRLLVLMAPGDLSANTPIDCLLENNDIDITFYYCSGQYPLADPVPEHDILMVGIAESDESRETLSSLTEALSQWPRPVINSTQHIPIVERQTAWRMLSDIPNLLIPSTQRVTREELQNISHDIEFPIILRPIGSHGGHGLEKIESIAELEHYLNRIESKSLYLSPFVDYRSSDGFFRKIRIALIAGQPFACHLAISSNWMIHYLNAGMYEDSSKRKDEADFMANFETFVSRYQKTLEAIYQRTQLEYLCIDCAETRDGQLLIFEIDHAMIVHAMDSVALFPHKQHHIQKIKQAFREYCLDRIASGKSGKYLKACND